METICDLYLKQPRVFLSIQTRMKGRKASRWRLKSITDVIFLIHYQSYDIVSWVSSCWPPDSSFFTFLSLTESYPVTCNTVTYLIASTLSHGVVNEFPVIRLVGLSRRETPSPVSSRHHQSTSAFPLLGCAVCSFMLKVCQGSFVIQSSATNTHFPGLHRLNLSLGVVFVNTQHVLWWFICLDLDQSFIQLLIQPNVFFSLVFFLSSFFISVLSYK